MWVSVCTVIFIPLSGSSPPHSRSHSPPNDHCWEWCMFLFSGPQGWKKKKNPTQIAPQGAINYFSRLYESSHGCLFFSRELDMYYSSFLAGNVHTDIFLYRLFMNFPFFLRGALKYCWLTFFPEYECTAFFQTWNFDWIRFRFGSELDEIFVTTKIRRTGTTLKKQR